ncbi:lipopolysaccharide assembly protein LapB [Leptotrichia sp. OH3620_COT-345]|uniref:tetratricopeptide repeat protein n=1 Tax=Leptotrichia sp. OH3620_COT-345 TaxID=2491048 RepID=UPI0013157C42|nr:tetratricopeptide repeat protein [Leptotrichia sp. OH3620_COT-345]
MKKVKKIALSLIIIFTVAMTVKGDLLGKIQTIDTLVQQGKYDRAEQAARRLLNDPNITPQEKASVQNLLNEISKKKNSQKQQQTVTQSTEKQNDAQAEIDKIISEAVQGENIATTLPPTADTGTVPITQTDDVSDGSKFGTYNNYEKAALAKRNASTIFQLCQLYFKDGLFERAANLAKKDTSGDLRNLYVVAISSRLMGNYDQSINYYNRILSVSPGEAQARLGIGIAYKGKGEFSKALEYLRAYAATNPDREVTRQIAVLNEVIANNKQ